MTAEDRAKITGLLLAYDDGEREAFDRGVSLLRRALARGPFPAIGRARSDWGMGDVRTLRERKTSRSGSIGGAFRDWRRLVGSLAVVGLAAACGGGSPSGPAPVPTYGPCDQQPNYVVAVGLNRWREFPLAYFFDDAAFTAEFRDVYREAITEGIRRWHDATANELGAVVEVGGPDEADFVITFRGVTPSGLAARTFHATGTPFLGGGEIAFNPTTLVQVEEDVRNGVTSRRGFRRGLAAIAAHEMGHLLGIIGHPNRDDSIMGDITLEFPTTADVHTLVHAYCRSRTLLVASGASSGLFIFAVRTTAGD